MLPIQPSVGSDLILILDRCGTQVSHFAHFCAAACDLLEVLRPSRAALVESGTTAQDACFTADLTRIRRALTRLTLDGDSALPTLLDTAAGLAAQSESTAVFLFTDGFSTDETVPMEPLFRLSRCGAVLCAAGLSPQLRQIAPWVPSENLFCCSAVRHFSLGFLHFLKNFADSSGSLPACSAGTSLPSCCPCPQAKACTQPEILTPQACCVGDTGRLIYVDVCLRCVCPAKPVALALLFNEVVGCGTLVSRGMKTLLIPARGGNCCQDVCLKNICFVVPEPKDACGCSRFCCRRRFEVSVLANYAESDALCCGPFISFSPTEKAPEAD